MIKDHRIDIIIGTHRLLQKDIKFSDLGLIIVDEEQRFGVNHKEKMKKMAVNVDMLTIGNADFHVLLYMSLTGAKAISQLNEPPPGKSIHTVVSEYSPKLIRRAIQAKIDRGGQVYFLHNHVRELETVQSQLKTWFPDLGFV